MALNYDEIDVSKISITTPQKTKRPGMAQAYINIQGSRNFVFTTPRMEATWGIKEWDDGGITLGLPFNNVQNDPELKAFYEKMQEVDEHIIKTALTHSTEWFNKSSISEGYARDKYTPIVKPSQDERWAPKLNLKLYKKDNDWVAKAYSEDGNLARMVVDGEVKKGLDVLEKGDEIICAVEVVWIFINATHFGPTLRLKQAMIFKKEHQDFDSGCQIVPPSRRNAQGPSESASKEEVGADGE
jgi:hypothetical protein